MKANNITVDTLIPMSNESYNLTNEVGNLTIHDVGNDLIDKVANMRIKDVGNYLIGFFANMAINDIGNDLNGANASDIQVQFAGNPAGKIIKIY